jgi:hypothetical protein
MVGAGGDKRRRQQAPEAASAGGSGRHAKRARAALSAGRQPALTWVRSAELIALVAEVLELQGHVEVARLERADHRLQVVALLADHADFVPLRL